MKDFGMMVSFDLRGGGRAAERFIDSLKLWYLAASLGGVESTVSYPVLTSHTGLSAKQLKSAGSVAGDGPAVGRNRRQRGFDRGPGAGAGESVISK
jgi:O-acetylhomoserine/O-acetylserine sulfhydrylase-like pyridoxal-dependent enzyme